MSIFSHGKDASCGPFQFGEFSWRAKVHTGRMQGYQQDSLQATLSLQAEQLQKQHPDSMSPVAPESGNSASQEKSLVRVSFSLCPVRSSSAHFPSYTYKRASSKFSGADGLDMLLNCKEDMLRQDYMDANGALTVSLHLKAKVDDMITHAAQHIVIQRQGPLGHPDGSLFQTKAL